MKKETNHYDLLQKLKALPAEKILNLFMTKGKEVTSAIDKDYKVAVYQALNFTLEHWYDMEIIKVKSLGLGQFEKHFSYLDKINN